MSRTKQLGLPLGRFHKRDIIRDAMLETRGGVSAVVQKAVLKEMAEYENNEQGCFASAKTLAANVGCSEAQVKNAWRVLTKQGFIHSIERKRRGYRGARSKERPIHWGNLALAANRPSSRNEFVAVAAVEQDALALAANRRSTANLDTDQRLMVERSTANLDTDQRLMVERSTANLDTDQRLMVSHEEGIEETKEQTTEESVVVVLNNDLARAEDAVSRARSHGLSDDEILERYNQWKMLPAMQRRSGTLYNWLAVPGSYEPLPNLETRVRGDAMSREEIRRATEEFRQLRERNRET